MKHFPNLYLNILCGTKKTIGSSSVNFTSAHNQLDLACNLVVVTIIIMIVVVVHICMILVVFSFLRRFIVFCVNIIYNHYDGGAKGSLAFRASGLLADSRTKRRDNLCVLHQPAAQTSWTARFQDRDPAACQAWRISLKKEFSVQRLPTVTLKSLVSNYTSR